MKASDIPIKPPDWSYWIEMKSVELIQAILLSVDIDPRSVPGRFKRPDTLRIDIPHCQELTKRTDIALNHYGKYVRELDDLKQPVELKEFRRWAEQLQNPWVFPNGFPSAADERVPGNKTASEPIRRNGEPWTDNLYDELVHLKDDEGWSNKRLCQRFAIEKSNLYIQLANGRQRSKKVER
jgi:hypothetical protein